MAAFAVEFAPAAVRDLKRLDPQVRAQLLRASSVLCRDPYPSQGGRVKLLTGITPAHFRLRVGDYRIIYRIEDSRVVIVRVSHRREAYR